jgi:hypothetical protein
LAPARGADREAADRLAGPPPGGLTGKVLDPSGHGIEGARVTLKRGDSLRTALTDAGGEYCFCRVAPARDYTLEIEKEGFTGVMDKDTYVGKMRVTVRNVILEPLSGLPGAEPGRR